MIDEAVAEPRDASAAVHSGPNRADAPVDLTIVIPCLDEAATIAAVVAKGVASIARLGLHGEVLVSLLVLQRR